MRCSATPQMRTLWARTLWTSGGVRLNTGVWRLPSPQVRVCTRKYDDGAIIWAQANTRKQKRSQGTAKKLYRILHTRLKTARENEKTDLEVCTVSFPRLQQGELLRDGRGQRQGMWRSHARSSAGCDGQTWSCSFLHAQEHDHERGLHHALQDYAGRRLHQRRSVLLQGERVRKQHYKYYVCIEIEIPQNVDNSLKTVFNYLYYYWRWINFQV